MFEIEELNDVFIRYGYTQREFCKNEYVIYSSGTSMYPAVEVVQFENADTETIRLKKSEYSEAGFAVRVCNVTTIEEVENYLFNLFFQVAESNQRNLRMYEVYTQSIMRSYEFDVSGRIENYKYINIPYTLYNRKNKKYTILNQKVHFLT